MGRLPATFQILSDDLSRHCVPLSPKGKAVIGIARHSPRRGKLFIPALACHSPRRGKLFIPAFARHSPRREKLFIPAFACHSPRRGKLFYISRRGKPFIYYVNTYLVLFCFVLFCFVLLYILWISFSILYKTASKFFHVKFFIVPLKSLDTVYKHGYNIQCKIV